MAKKKVSRPLQSAAPAETDILKLPAELRYRDELDALAAADSGPVPPGWKLSPRMVRTFLLGPSSADPAAAKLPPIKRKFHGDDPLVERAIVTLMSNRGLLFVGEPGTAKSMLSELLAAAISGSSSLTIQGSAGTTEDQIKYSWNYALLLAEGPTPRAMVPAPLFQGLTQGAIVRFEEITRCAPEIQDVLISVLSDKVLHVPELQGTETTLYARPGFNIIATANTRDRGVHEMSSALKRRFNFETVKPIADRQFELELVMEQARELLNSAQAPVEMPVDAIDVLVTTFSDLRRGRTEDGTTIDRPTTIMSTAEAVSVVFAAGLDAYYYGKGEIQGEHLSRQLTGTVLKDSPEDGKKVRHYFDVVVKPRAQHSKHWKSFFAGRGGLGE